MQNFRVYDGEANNVATKVFGGKSSGIRDWDDVKYPQMLEINSMLFEEYWTEQEIKLGKDIEEYREKLTPAERKVFNTISGKLNWLDSIATDFNFVLGYLCTDSSVRSVIAMIGSFEQLHNRSYQYLTSSMLNQQEKEQAFEETRRIPVLVKRNELVIDPIQNMVNKAKEHLLSDSDDISDELLEAIADGLLGDVLLEGLYFSAGFVYFHSLARDQKMIGSNNMIQLIKDDENQHSVFFGLLYQILLSENPQLATSERYEKVVNYIKEAVKREKEWGTYIFEDIDTLSIKEYHDYVEYLANLICRNIGVGEVFPNNTQLKSNWINTYGKKRRSGEENEIVTRTDFLQGNAINYSHESGEDFDL